MFKRSLRHLAVSLALFTPLVSMADVSIKLSDQAEWVVVNGVNTSGNMPLTLNNGEHQLAFRIRTDYRSNGETSLYTSPVQIVTFQAVDDELALELPPIRNKSDEIQFSRKPQFSFTTKSGEPINYTTDVLRKSGLQLGRDFEKEIAEYNLRGEGAALQGAVAIANLPEGIDDNKQSAQDQINEAASSPEIAEQMLEFWYAQADDETKARFKQKLLTE
ncbi:DUF2057 family protein [Thaumasiovibrio sp. DFM-14]|uniref:YccT family protein n=1 Tax=Thaumasiovibrio sp. DFM-14 TaxID=3384792 RepID=UPI0039A253EE